MKKHLTLSLLAFVFLFVATGKSAVASGGAAALPMLAQAEGAGMNWWYLISQIVLAVVLIIMAFRPQPALHKQFADKADTDKKLDEIKQTMDAIFERLREDDALDRKSRRDIYLAVNAHSTALAFMAGRMAGKGDLADAAHVRSILERAEKGQEL